MRELVVCVQRNPLLTRVLLCPRVYICYACAGEMIGCENENCPTEWFHMGCVGLSAVSIAPCYNGTGVGLRLCWPRAQHHNIFITCSIKNDGYLSSDFSEVHRFAGFKSTIPF